jgi:hypothetical protein
VNTSLSIRTCESAQIACTTFANVRALGVAREFPCGLVQGNVFAKGHPRPETDVGFELDASTWSLLFFEIRLEEGQEVAQNFCEKPWPKSGFAISLVMIRLLRV